jgi:hypothetical protein
MTVRSFALVIAALFVLAALCVAAEPAPPACEGNCSAKCQQESCPPGPELKIWGGLESKPAIADGYEPEKVEIAIGSYKLLELHGPAAGYTLAEREVVVYNRLTEALSQGPVTPKMICVGKVRSAPTIYVGPVRFVSVYARDAAAVQMTQEQLACAWAKRLVEVLPKITVATAELKPVPIPGIWAPTMGPEVFEIAVGGTVIFRLRGPDGCDSVAARGQDAQLQVNHMLSDGREKGVVAIAKQVDGEWIVSYAGDQVVTITAADAAANKTTPELLAKAWAAKLTAILPKVKGPTGDTTSTTCP